GVHEVVLAGGINLLAFFATALVCHGELARDRPSTRHLTEFYLLMSVGGMLGGMFNGLLAPIVFQKGVWEFPIALFVAALVRPVLAKHGWLDWLLSNGTLGPSSSGGRGGRGGRKGHDTEPTDGTTLGLDIGIPVGIAVLTVFLRWVLANTSP